MRTVSRKQREANILALRKKICREQDAITRDFDIPALKDEVGKCYVYINSYGSGDEKGDWPLYIQVVKVTDGAHLETIEFQHTSHDEFSLKGSMKFGRIDSNYQEISFDEYIKAKNEFVVAFMKKFGKKS